MKESTGELNMTVVTVVAIAAIAAFFYLIVWPGMKSNIEQSQKCASAVCQTCAGKTCDCQYYNSDTGSYEDVTCPNKDADNA